MAYPSEPKVTRYGCDLSGADWCPNGRKDSLEALQGYDGSGYYYDAAGGGLYLKIATSADSEYDELKIEPGGQAA